MLGNYSFGGYTKRDASALGNGFISSPEYLGLRHLIACSTVFTDDDEAQLRFEVWQQKIPHLCLGQEGQLLSS